MQHSLFLTKNSQVGERILCRHPFSESKRAYVVPQRVEELLKCFWAGKSGAVPISWSVEFNFLVSRQNLRVVH